MINFANFKNGVLTFNNYRFADAQATDLADILSVSTNSESKEILTASIDSEEDLKAVEALIIS